jgi:hypothetical protein
VQALCDGLLTQRRRRTTTAFPAISVPFRAQTGLRNNISQYENPVHFAPDDLKIEAKSGCFADCAQPVVFHLV